jgi:hypothetical protein
MGGRRNLTRREALLAMLWLGECTPLWPQGMASRGVKPLPRGKPSGIPFDARFVDVAKEAGLQAPIIYGGVDRKKYIIETTGCGAAFLDYDNDGWLDIFLLGGTRIEALSGDSPPEGTNRLYKNNRDGTFTDVTDSAGLRRSGWASAVAVGDYNNDGYEDLFITYWGQNALYRNNGDGTFTDVTRAAGLLQSGTHYGSGCTFIDYDRDGYLDLFVANYLEFEFHSVPSPGEKATCKWKDVPVNCGPRGLPLGRNWLYRNNGDGTFTDVSETSRISTAKAGYCLTAVAADFDNDGWPDIYVACDSTAALLYLNNHDGTFREVGMERGVGLNDDGLEQANMGVGVGDYNLDGSLDLFVTHFMEDTDILYRNDGRGFFDDVTIESGLGVETRFVSWGTGIADLDNDGLPDLFLVTGNVYPEVEKALPDTPYRTPRVIFRNLGNGKFEEILEGGGPAIAAPHASRGCAFGDFDNDGDVDMLIVNMNEPPSLLRNDLGSKHHWLKVRLIGVKSNRSAIGARVTAHYGGRLQAQEVLSQASFFSANDLRLHFGLGSATAADLEVRWPNGMKERVTNVPANRLIVIREGFGIFKVEKLQNAQ